jgi:secondary thiamine-phosphate synthase enzyme
MVLTEKLEILSEGDFYAANITEQVRAVVKRSGVSEGSALVYYLHTTGAVMVVEHEAGILVDLEDALEKVALASADYKHHRRGYDINGAAHVRTALLSVSVTLPVVGGDLLLGEYQEILVIDMDPGPKVRTVVVQAMGE